MPSVSDKQRRAMQAAAHGKSNLGIPKSVGKEFAAADAHKKNSPFTLKLKKKKAPKNL
jgi:hypothetical protein